MRNPIGIILLTVVWLALTGSLTIPNALLGLGLSLLASSFAREQRRRSEIAIRPLRVIGLAALFVWELVLSGYRVARLVLTPRMQLQPGIFAYRLKVDRNFEITLLANMITLTPGTLSVDVSADRKTLYVHAIDCSDPDRTRRDIADGFERKILEAFR
jgi:multicomponent Na+:H+ antiporter subunit E